MDEPERVFSEMKLGRAIFPYRRGAIRLGRRAPIVGWAEKPADALAVQAELDRTKGPRTGELEQRDFDESACSIRTV